MRACVHRLNTGFRRVHGGTLSLSLLFCVYCALALGRALGRVSGTSLVARGRVTPPRGVQDFVTSFHSLRVLEPRLLTALTCVDVLMASLTLT